MEREVFTHTPEAEAVKEQVRALRRNSGRRVWISIGTNGPELSTEHYASQDTVTQPKPSQVDFEGKKCTPAGGLRRLLETFEAPEEVQIAMARRIGGLSGTTLLPDSKVENVIANSMKKNGGLPDWSNIQAEMSTVVRIAYKNLRRS